MYEFKWKHFFNFQVIYLVMEKQGIFLVLKSLGYIWKKKVAKLYPVILGRGTQLNLAD